MKSLLSEGELKRLAEVISEVERKTSGEMRLILVSRSSRTTHVFPMIWLLCVCFGLMVLWYERYQFVLTHDWWLIPAIFVLSFPISILLARLPFLHRSLTPDDELQHQALQRAELEFHREGLSGTQGRTGILLFLSLFEHQAVVLADKSINEKLDASTWKKVVETMLAGAKGNQWAPKLEEAVRLCGTVLAQHFPAQAGDRNELPNHVLVKEF